MEATHLIDPSKNMNIMVIYGGEGNEREVSIKTKNNVVDAMRALGFKGIVEYDYRHHGILTELQRVKPQAAFIAMHGEYGEDGQLQSILDATKVAYTHSGKLASSISMNKPMARIVAKDIAGLKCARGGLVSKQDACGVISHENFAAGVKVIVKPYDQGSSMCTFVAHTGEALQPKDIDSIQQNPCPYYLVEEFFEGLNIAITVINGKAIGAVEICHEGEFFTYHGKYASNETEYHCPPRVIPAEAVEAMLEDASKIHNAIGCGFLSRVDFLANSNGDYIFIELNTHPGLTERSLVPITCREHGMTYDQLILGLLRNASCE